MHLSDTGRSYQARREEGEEGEYWPKGSRVRTRAECCPPRLETVSSLVLADPRPARRHPETRQTASTLASKQDGSACSISSLADFRTCVAESPGRHHAETPFRT